MKDYRDDSVDEILEDTKQYLKQLDDDDARPRENEPVGGACGTAVMEKPKRKKRRAGKIILIALLLLIAAFALWYFMAGQPCGGEMRLADGTLAARKPGCCTVLLAGTDAGDARTDTMLLLHLNAPARKAALISLPRDTYVSGGYSVPKLNSALGAGGGGAEGMQELMERVTEIIGYRPDGYALINLDAFVNIINLLGGVDFDVPQDMYYHDPTQDLLIDLKAGMQHLDGKQAMGLVRFRSGYAQADLRRVEVQRDFLKAALSQHLTLKNLPKAPALVGSFLAGTTTDLSSGNLLWIARTLLACDREEIVMQTLPGAPRTISGGSYYLVDASAAAELLNECANPYEETITSDLLNVRR